MGRKNSAAIAIILLLGGLACKKVPDYKNGIPPTNIREAYIVCEGAYTHGDGSLGLYLPDKDSVYNDVYNTVNGQGIGDIFQSMVRIGDYYFLVVNNSGKVLVIHRDTRLLAGSIPIPQPRYILPVSATKAYVSTLYSNQVYIINPQSMQVTGTITMPYQNTEGMLLYGNTAYMCSWDTACTRLCTVNTMNDAVGNAIALNTAAPQSIAKDTEGKLWVLSGNVSYGKTAALTRIDPASNTILKTYSFPATADPLRLEMNPGKDTLYFIEVNYNGGSVNNGVYRMGIHDAALPAQSFIGAQGFQYYYGLGIEPVSGYIYVGDPLGFTQHGDVYIYRQDGVQLKKFSTGIGPGHFYFDE